MDKLGQFVYDKPELLYYYKGLVATPPLQMVDDILGIQKCSSKSRNLNTSINTFIELEKLKLSESKCSNVHIGNNLKNCQEFKVHGKKMKHSNQETYLGDKIDRKISIKETIKSRISKGFGAVSNILAIVNEVPLAHWRIEAGLQLRQAMLLNSILFNSEAWHGVSDVELGQLEKVDEALLRGLLNAHSKVPLESLYLETGCIPIRFIIKTRRLSYLHNILQKECEELVREVYEAQKHETSDGDFIQLVKKDANQIGIDLNDNEIAKAKKEDFKNLVKSKVRNAAFQYLIEMKQKHSKMRNIEYTTFEVQDYLKSPLFTSDNRSTLYALRTRTVRGIRSDFGQMYQDQSCPLGCGDRDTLPNILTCDILKNKSQSESPATNCVKFEDIFCNDVVKQKEITQLYSQLLKVREEILNSSTNNDAGQCINLQECDRLSVT